MTARPLSIWDIEAFYKGMTGHPFMNISDMMEFEKSSGMMHTGRGSSEEYVNRVYGLWTWSHLNQEANAFGLLPKTTWVRSGWRVKTAFASASDDLGVAETGSIPSAVYPTIKTVYAKPKTEALTMQVSDIHDALANMSQDDIWGNANQLRAELGIEFVKRINQRLLKNAETTASNNMDSIDRVCCSHAYANAELSAASDADIYNIDRSANSWSDAHVDYNSGVDRDITLSAIRGLLTEIKEYQGNTTVMLTGWDTEAAIKALYTNIMRYLPMQDAKVQMGINGIQSAEGIDYGVPCAAVEGIPLLVSNDVVSTGSISDLYALDTSDPEGYGVPRLGMSILRPSEYYETRDPLILEQFAVKGVYRMVGQLVCRHFKSQGVLKYLQE